jgi:hypothetical protein
MMLDFDDVTDSYPIRRLLRVFARADIHDELFWGFYEEGELKFFALCSDIFEWGTADMEEIREEDLDLLEQTHRDLMAVSIADRTQAWAVAWTAELYAARKRQKRPQGAVYANMPEEIRPLFDACGPERKVDVFNPSEQP